MQHPSTDREGWLTSGPPGGMAWRGVGEVVVDGRLLAVLQDGVLIVWKM